MAQVGRDARSVAKGLNTLLLLSACDDSMLGVGENAEKVGEVKGDTTPTESDSAPAPGPSMLLSCRPVFSDNEGSAATPHSRMRGGREKRGDDVGTHLNDSVPGLVLVPANVTVRIRTVRPRAVDR